MFESLNLCSAKLSHIAETKVMIFHMTHPPKNQPTYKTIHPPTYPPKYEPNTIKGRHKNKSFYFHLRSQKELSNLNHSATNQTPHPQFQGFLTIAYKEIPI